MNVERYSDILQKEADQLKDNGSGLSDFSEGSIIMTMLEAFARRIEQLYIDTRNGFNTNLKTMAYTIFNFEKKAGTYATGYVTFYRSTAIDSDTAIPLGTEIKAGDLVFTTTEAGKIGSGALQSAEIPIVASEVGTEYNVTAEEINTISSIVPSDIVRVSNESGLTGGTDEETDLETSKRFIDYINGLDGNNKYAVEAAVLAIDGVKDVAIVEHFPPDDNGNNFTLYVDTGGEGISSALKTNIINAVDGDGTAAYPGHKAVGIQWDLQGVRNKEIDIVYTASCELADESTVEEEMNTVIENAVNGLGIGEDLIISDLIAKLRSLTYVKDCSIVSPKNNVTIEAGYVAHANSVTRG